MFNRLVPRLLVGAALALPAASMFAGTIPYSGHGVAPTVPTYATDNNGVGINLYYFGSNAGYNEGIYVYDVQTKYTSGVVLDNKTSTPGDTVTVGAGSIFAGDQLVFFVNSPAGKFASDPAYSVDGANHVYITSYAGGMLNGKTIPAGLFLGFEDEPVTSSDLDYNDVEIITTGVTTAATPEPSSIALLGTGILGLGGMIRRRRLA